MFATPMVNLYTRGIEAGLRFYRDLLGFIEAFRTPSAGIPSHVELPGSSNRTTPDGRPGAEVL